MMTIVSHVRISEGQEPAWDAAFRERAASARERPGFVSVQLCIPVDRLDERAIIGTWESRADWEAWHEDPAFRATRDALEHVDQETVGEWWHEVVLEQHR